MKKKDSVLIYYFNLRGLFCFIYTIYFPILFPLTVVNCVCVGALSDSLVFIIIQKYSNLIFKFIILNNNKLN